MPDNTQLPATRQPIGDVASDLGAAGLPPSLRILLDDGFYNRVKQLAGVMSKAVGFTPAHLVDKPEACFAVINISLDAKLSPHFVARHTYQTPGGQIGFDGALIQSILEQSGKFIGAPIFEYHGDWSAIVGKFEEATSDKGRKYMRRTWTGKDAVGLGVIVRWFVRGEKVARVWPGEKEPFWLTQCFPLNSPLWATDPKTQIAYLAIRRFANITSPGILGAAAHDYDEIIDASESARDVTPPQRPRRSDPAFREPPIYERDGDEEEASEDIPLYTLTNCDGEQFECTGDVVEDEMLAILDEAKKRGDAVLEAVLDNNEHILEEIVNPRLGHEFMALRAYLARARDSKLQSSETRWGDRADPTAKRYRATKAEMEERRRVQRELSSGHHDRLEQDAHIAHIQAQQQQNLGSGEPLPAGSADPQEQNPADGPPVRSPADGPIGLMVVDSSDPEKFSAGLAKLEATLKKNPADGPPVRSPADALSDDQAVPQSPPSSPGEAESPRSQPSPPPGNASLIVPMRYERDGETPAYRAWWLGPLLDSVRKSISLAEAHKRLSVNSETIQAYFSTISTRSREAALTERDEILMGLQ